MSETVVKVPYVCGPLTELPITEQERCKRFYEAIADTCEMVIGVRAFVPHEHYDPFMHANFTPQDVDAAERKQVCMRTSILIAVPLAPSWGGGIEVEMAYRSTVPILLLCEKHKLDQRLISRLLRGNPGVREIISYESEKDALLMLRYQLPIYVRIGQKV